MSNFLTNVKSEFSKVVWPTFEELKGGTWITLLVTIIFTLFVWGADTVISFLAQMWYGI